MRSLFFHNLRITIKESLHCQCTVDSFVELWIPTPEDIFEEDMKPLCSHQKRGKYSLDNIRSLDSLVGKKKRNFRIDENKDFAYVSQNRVHLRLSERKPLTEYSTDGGLTISHRGFVLVIQFVRGLGNSSDLPSFLDSFYFLTKQEC